MMFNVRSVQCKPHPAKARKGGEDAFFTHSSAIGVADGVGGWNRHGIDPAPYARKLMSNCLAAATALSNDSAVDIEHTSSAALAILNDAYFETEKSGLPGSATATVVALEKPPTRKNCVATAITVGDSGVRIYRQSGELIYASEEQYEDVNCPKQLGRHSRTRPHNGIAYSWNVEHRDVVVAGSDGLFDNLFDKEIRTALTPLFEKLKSVSSSLGDLQRTAESVCAAICGDAFKHSARKCETPFSVKAGCEPRGKPDDITVVLAVLADGPLSGRPPGESCPKLIEEYMCREGLKLTSKL